MENKEISKKYTNGEITIVWQPSVCIHSTICWKGKEGLKAVFNPMERPWIKPEGATTEEIMAQIDKCPSGALSYYRNDEKPTTLEAESLVETKKNGPLLVYGNVVIKDHEGKAVPDAAPAVGMGRQETRKGKVTAFCRCGASQNKPYCDGSHIKIGFEG